MSALSRLYLSAQDPLLGRGEEATDPPHSATGLPGRTSKLA
jgi:hypothetical protein